MPSWYDTTTMTINIVHQKIELTSAIRAFAEEKMRSLEKYGDSVQHIDIEVGRSNGHQQKGDVFFCKAIVQLPGHTMRVERDAEDLYKAIDKVRDHLRVEVADWKHAQTDRFQGKR